MRFTEFGPSIPNELLDARDAGEVVFLCGAGVSIPAGLPDFFSLTASVADNLGVQPGSDIGRLIELGRQSRHGGAASSIHDTVSFDRIFALLVRTFGVSQVETEVIAALTATRRPNLDHHRALLDLARGPDGRQRLVTTNFDRLFERAQRRLHAYAPPHFPDLSRGNGFDGIVHLHGVLPTSAVKHFGDPLGLVLSSGDFGRAYLADAWATRFICDLLDRHIVVLLGYSADDPPMRYLLEGLSLSGRARERRLYAFVSSEAPDLEADWRARGVTSIAYDPAERHRHLWDSIQGWAQRARDPVAWRKRIAAVANTSPQQLKPFERGQVVALCSSKEGAQVFASSVPPRPADWLCVFDAVCRYWEPERDFAYGEKPSPRLDPLDHYGLDDDPPRPRQPAQGQPRLGIDVLAPLKADELIVSQTGLIAGPRQTTSPLNTRLLILAQWIQSVMASPTTIWWAARRGALHRHVHQQLCWALDHGAAKCEPVVRLAWRLVLEAQDALPDDMREGWWAVQSQIRTEGWTTRTIREFAIATRPRITVQGARWAAHVPPDDDSPITLQRIARFDVTYPKLIEIAAIVPDASLAAVIEAIRGNLQLGAVLESEISDIRPRLPTLYPEDKPGDRYHNKRAEYYVTFADLYRRLIVFDAAAARREYQFWNGSPPFFTALSVWALAYPSIVTPKEVGCALRKLDRETFWSPYHARELLWAIRARWPTLSLRDRQAVESKFLQGRAKSKLETVVEYRERRATLAAAWLVWMQQAGLKLGQRTSARLAVLKKTIPNWQDSWAKEADDSHEGRSGWVKQETDPTPLVGLPLSEVIARCDVLAQRRFLSFTDHDPFRGLVETAPRRAMAVLAYEARNGNYPEPYWSRLLSAWPKTATPRRIVLLGKALAGSPLHLSAGLRHELGQWMAAHYAKIDTLDRKLAQALFDHVVEALENDSQGAMRSAIEKSSVGGVEIPSNRMGLEFAINSPTGDLAQALMNALLGRKPRPNQKIPVDLKYRIERLLYLPDEGGHHALTIVARNLHWLYIIDRNWTRTVLLPRFDPSLPAAEAAWSGFLSAGSMPSAALFRELKRAFLEAVTASARWTCQEITDLGEILILALEPQLQGKALVSAAEGRIALKSASSAVREQSLSFLRSRVGQNGAWDRLVVPFFRNVWPRERKFQTAATTYHLVLFLGELEALFPQGVALVADFLVSSSDTDSLIFQFGSDREHGHVDLTMRFPHETLLLLSHVVDQTQPRPPYGLVDVVSRLAEAAPELRHDERWQRLHRFAQA
jgi:hypothetical protein